MRQTCVIIRNFGVWLSLYYQIKLFIMRESLVEDVKIVENHKDTASILNEFFSNIIATLGRDSTI